MDTSAIRQQMEAEFKLMIATNMNLEKMVVSSNNACGFAEEIRNIQLLSYIELQGINKNTKETVNAINGMAEDIKIVKEKL